MLVGCKSIQYVPIATNDSTRLEVREITIKELDTIYFEIPAQSAERVTKDTISSLETDYAYSYAQILPDGSLLHSLKNKVQSIPKEFEKESKHTDSTYTKWRIKEVPVEVEKKLTKWQQFKQDVGGMAIGIVLIWFLYFAIRFLRFGK